LKNCHWVGKGSCDDNNCADDDIQLSLSTYGDSSSMCGVAGRKKSLLLQPSGRHRTLHPSALGVPFPRSSASHRSSEMGPPNPWRLCWFRRTGSDDIQ
jgi:hypothetical protein